MSHANILQEAERIVNGDRMDEYGDMKESFRRIAALWSGYLDVSLSSHDVAYMMILLKVSRAKNGYHVDSVRDIAGYAYCSSLLVE